MAEVETVIKGGTVVDGTGRSGFPADVAVSNGRIVDIGPRLKGRRVIDATGCVVSPGFVDIHTHYDAQVFWDPMLTPSAYHGVTSVVAGNCGFSIAPIRPENVALMGHTLEYVEDMSFEALSEGVPWSEFQTFPDYLRAVERRGVAINYGGYVGHTAVRMFAMGDASYEREATPSELQAMQQAVTDAIDAGALGFATSANPLHKGDMGRPVPSRLATMEELRTLLQPLRTARKGVIAMLPGVIPHEQVFEIQREIGRPLTWTALLTRDTIDHEAIIEHHRQAWAQGLDVWPQVSCRPLVFQMNLAAPFILNTRPSFGALMGRPMEERQRAYRDPAWRARAYAELLADPVRWPSFTVAESDNCVELIGRHVLDIADERGCTPLDVLLDVSLADNLNTRFRSVVCNDNIEGVSWLLTREHVLLGLGDGGAHVSQVCDSIFATDLLGNWVRERGVLSLEHAVHKLSGEPARFLGLHDRGEIKVGKAADICVFDPSTVATGPLRRLRDLPAGAERLTADAPVGVHHVLVNGTPIRLDGEVVSDAVARRPGQILRSR